MQERAAERTSTCRTQRAIVLLDQVTDSRVLFELASFVLNYQIWRGELSAAWNTLKNAMSRIDGSGRSSTLHDTMIAGGYWAMLSWLDGEPSEAFQRVDEAIKIADETGVHVFDDATLTQGVFAATLIGDIVITRDLVRVVEARVKAGSPLASRINLLISQCGRALLQNELERARNYACAAIAEQKRVGIPWGDAYLYLVFVPIAIAQRDLVSAATHLDKALGIVRRLRAASQEFTALIQLAHLHFARDGSEACLPALREALAFGRERGYMTAHPWWLPDVMSKLLGLALEHDIEPDYVRRLIIKRKLAPPEPAPEAWPFVLRIRTLGGFELRVNDAPLTPSRKVPRKALDLLKVVVAMGGKDVTATAVATALWPDVDGDAARTSFDTTLHRLRKLLGSDDVLLLEQGKLTLSATKIWVDVWTLERLEADGSSDTAKSAERLLALYRGPFLGGDEEAPWLLPVSERLRSRFVRSVERLADVMEQSGHTDPMLDLLVRAIEIESVQESLYRRLMRAQVALGRQAEAIATYRRCRHMLSVVLGVAPSRETEGLRASIGLVA